MNVVFLALSKILREISEDLELRAEDKKPKFNCNITEGDVVEIIKYISNLNDNRLSKDQACSFLNMSRATFDRRVAEGSIPKGVKIKGWKELSWNKLELEELITHSK